ncbi:hypothetical protein BGZ74_004664 [Mortierella antarctica]|nr:hypothetical protein BGZ74_004664 [Mortierella antarctica]
MYLSKNLSKNLSALVVLAVLAVVVQASPVALEKRETYGCPSTNIRCIYHCKTAFQPPQQGMCYGDNCRCN